MCLPEIISTKIIAVNILNQSKHVKAIITPVNIPNTHVSCQPNHTDIANPIQDVLQSKGQLRFDWLNRYKTEEDNMSRQNVTPIEWVSTPITTPTNPSKDIPRIFPDIAREDGELSDGDSDPDDYNILPRPVHVNPTMTIPAAIAGNANRLADNKTDNASLPGPLLYSDDEKSSSSSDSESDDDHPVLKKRMQPVSFNSNNSIAFRNPNASGFTDLETAQGPKVLTDCEEKMLNFQEKRKVNNIWADVLQEEQQQQALDKFESIDVEGKRVLIERGPESYTFKPGTQGSLGKRKRENKQRGKKEKTNDDDSDVSSTALSDDDVTYIRQKKSAENGGASSSQKKILSGFHETSELPISEVRAKLVKMKGRKLSYLIARELQEPKTQLIVRACEILGKHYCIDLFIKTLKIEKKGGLLVKTQTRRRTPGGIFFYMLRKDDKYPPEKIDAVFEVDKQIVTRDRRNVKAARRKEQKAKVELLQHRLDKMKGTKPMDEEKKDCVEANIDEEDGELPSYEESSGSDSDTDMSDYELGDDVVQSIQDQELADEASNDYLDIHCNVDEFNDL
ncbi:unnamed protein product [Allacma fusca]|uniref:Phosphorylated adapter RNA export protein RNA-binding domain-containing protein n=1 Tax=Allacma fusca TaxID=39272 RepID=A0A8J2JZA4_9HEXA|nr:unnamed protein product [Allacma fusca]